VNLRRGHHWVIENDGDVLVVVPLVTGRPRPRGMGFDYRRTAIYRRPANIPKEQFLGDYPVHPVPSEVEEMQQRVLEELRITAKQMDEALRCAHYEKWGHKYLKKFILSAHGEKSCEKEL
jgi:hypothetical protein